MSLAVIGLVSLLAFAPPQFFSDVQSITDLEESTAHHRLSMWQDGVEIFIDNPVFGIGLMNFPSYHGHHFIETGRSAVRTNRWKVAHSDPVTVLCELGALGMTLYLLIIYNILKINILFQRAAHYNSGDISFGRLANGIFTGFMGYLVCSVFLTLIYYPHFYIFDALSSVLWRLYSKGGAFTDEPPSSGSLKKTNA